jgi:hypothetical protein
MLRRRERKDAWSFSLVRSRGRRCAPVAANSDAPNSSDPLLTLIRRSQPESDKCFHAVFRLSLAKGEGRVRIPLS